MLFMDHGENTLTLGKHQEGHLVCKHFASVTAKVLPVK